MLNCRQLSSFLFGRIVRVCIPVALIFLIESHTHIIYPIYLCKAYSFAISQYIRSHLSSISDNLIFKLRHTAIQVIYSPWMMSDTLVIVKFNLICVDSISTEFE